MHNNSGVSCRAALEYSKAGGRRLAVAMACVQDPIFPILSVSMLTEKSRRVLPTTRPSAWRRLAKTHANKALAALHAARETIFAASH
ncbi:hypothetical protein E2C01_068773 [Portunus trituberculatus]|uniref:Uncharacterized protein n=1 Tax=Portunus trituberculatus TaxID=210409 RepID=A0A5B7HX36_PORTR|nr:hypothetical protein [Portunus trituberculatus]